MGQLLSRPDVPAQRPAERQERAAAAGSDTVPHRAFSARNDGAARHRRGRASELSQDDAAAELLLGRAGLYFQHIPLYIFGKVSKKQKNRPHDCSSTRALRFSLLRWRCTCWAACIRGTAVRAA